jgi:hypothetical protein
MLRLIDRHHLRMERCRAKSLFHFGVQGTVAKIDYPSF